MGNGGIYDQIEGGFFRYSVDEKWIIPHFEKMLYTNAELLNSYAKAYLITKDKFYKNIVDETINFVTNRFEKQNLLYSASDADSAYFVFSQDEVSNFLETKNYKKKQIQEVLQYFDISFEGNFENGFSNPNITKSIPIENLEKIKNDLKELRAKKPYPFVDYKILTSWNGMYVSSLFTAGKIDEKYSQKALVILNTLVEKLYVNNTLYHQRLLNEKPKVKALLEDYAFLTQALSDDLKTQEIAKKTFEKESYLLKNKSTNLSWLFRNYIAYKKEFVIIKSSKENLLKNSTVNLPFTLKKVEDTNKYLACKIGVCFDYDDNFDTLVRKVKSVQDF